ncbi:helix-turn-helix domain-containing protein [Streptomyces sp. XD-27]|uniref:helix-turn-helix domain-containing protein n=1 Tax=Streptomyces sp. XD-27 TaxID=3062779 RepID=UPI0026F41970|nr:helix-turn-helix domain-containing protein [Streptomyces sp. XD-27]WKX74524.1 transcriptional regulator [Streptomyces sp. XD-27]
MVDPWLAMAPGTDPAERSRAVRRAHEAFLAQGSVGPGVRPVVAASWRRSADALASPEAMAPIDLADAELAAYRAEHPLSRVMPLFRELLGSIADDGAHLLAVCDEQGRLLWVEGHSGVRRRAERMNFVAGARWDERHAGTNAPGTALTVDHAVQIFATEHYNPRVQPWTCAAAPLHDPRTGRLLGAVDITGGDHLAAPQSLALVRATARAAEAQLAAPASYPTGPRVALTALGRDDALLVADGERIRLSRRHSEIMVLLAGHPEGLTGERLALELYGERADQRSPVTLRAELSRLRRLAGPLLASRPYRLCAPLVTDVTAVAEELAAGNLHAALRAYHGPLLPLSDAPGVCRMRRRLEDRLRWAVLSRRDPELLRRWTESPWGEDDLEVCEALLAALPACAPGRTALVRRIDWLRAAYGLGDPCPSTRPAADQGPADPRPTTDRGPASPHPSPHPTTDHSPDDPHPSPHPAADPALAYASRAATSMQRGRG